MLQRGLQTLGDQWRVSMDQKMQETVHQVLHAQASAVIVPSLKASDDFMLLAAGSW